MRRKNARCLEQRAQKSHSSAVLRMLINSPQARAAIFRQSRKTILHKRTTASGVQIKNKLKLRITNVTSNINNISRINSAEQYLLLSIACFFIITQFQPSVNTKLNNFIWQMADSRY